MPRTLLAALALLLAHAAHADEPIQGTWKGMIGPGKTTPITLKVEGTAVTVTVTPIGAEARTFKGTIKLDDAKSPKEMDWTGVDADGKPLADTLAIYELAGDTLKIGSNGPDKKRPKAFAEDAADPSTVILKRETAAK